jgi:hypothetical protein
MLFQSNPKTNDYSTGELLGTPLTIADSSCVDCVSVEESSDALPRAIEGKNKVC